MLGQSGRYEPVQSLRISWSRYIQHTPTAKQLAFLMLSCEEAFYGGSAGGGKSDALLMAALQYVDVPGYAALLLRRTYADLILPEALMDRARQWLSGTDAQWRDSEKSWRFPSGATLSFGYLDNENDVYRYQSSAFQFCVAKGTPVLMGDGSWRPIERIAEGDQVQTLGGPECVLKVHRLGQKPVVLVRSHAGEALVSAQHRLLCASGDWRTPTELLATRYSPSDNNGGCSFPTCAVSALHHVDSPYCQGPAHERAQRSVSEKTGQGCGVLTEGGQIYSSAFADVRAVALQPRSCSAHLVLYGQYRHSMGWHRDYRGSYGACHESLPVGSATCYQPYLRCDGAQLRHAGEACQDSTRRLSDAARQTPTCRSWDGQENTPGHSPQWYVHPYTKDYRQISGAVRPVSVDISLAGESEVLDLTVSSQSHYIIYPGYVSSNCGFDELTQFTESQYRYLFSRLRRLQGVDVPVRMRSASNPGGRGHEWVKQRFITEGIEHGRVFIPAALADNPFLDRESYVHSLDQLGVVLRAQLLEGDWSARNSGSMFRREWFKVVDAAPANCAWVRAWDMAATESTDTTDPDWSAGCLMGLSDGKSSSP